MALVKKFMTGAAAALQTFARIEAPALLLPE
jgi:hypothetical protein